MGRWFLLMVLSAALVACGPASPTGQRPSSPSSAQSPGPTAPKVLVASITEDPKNFWDGINGGGGSGARELGHLVNQYLAVLSSYGQSAPGHYGQSAPRGAVTRGRISVGLDG